MGWGRQGRHLLLLASMLATSIVAPGCKPSGTPGIVNDEIIVGEYGSMTGSEATFGQSTHNGLLLAVDEINAGGGIKGKKVRLVNYDDQGKTSEVGTAVTRLITSDKVLAVIGEVASSLSIAGGQICQQQQTPMISPSSTNPRVTEVGDYVFRVCFIDPFQGYVMAKFMTDAPGPGGKNGLGMKKVALLVDQRQAYSQGLSHDFETALTKMGGIVVANEKYQGGDQDFSAQISRIKAAAPEAIYIPGYYTDVANVARQIRNAGIPASVPLLGGDGWESVADMGVAELDGAYYTNHYSPSDPSPAVKQFVNKYTAKYQKTPDSMSALSYDAIYLLKDAIERAPAIERKAVRDQIAQTGAFKGVTGTIAIDGKRNARKPAVVLQVHAATKDVSYQTTIQPPQ